MATENPSLADLLQVPAESLEEGLTDAAGNPVATPPEGDGKGEPAAAAAEGDPKDAKEGEGDPTKDAKDADPAKAKEGEGDGEGEGDDEDEADPKVVASRLRELKQLMRDLTRENASLKSRYADLEKQLKEGGHIAEKTPEQEALAAQQAQLNERLGTMLETMRMSDKYGDVDEVVTQSRADDLIDMMAQELATRNGMTIDKARTAVEASVWYEQRNPYRFLYDAIKKFHTDFSQKPKTETGQTASQTPKKGAPSIAGAGGQNGSGVGGGTWTAEKIDAMNGVGLEKVPPDIYEKYLAGELD